MHPLLKLSVIGSLLWMLVTLIVSILIGSEAGVALFFALGVLPIGVLWGLGWILSGASPQTRRNIFLILIVFTVFVFGFYTYQQFSIYFSEKAILNARWGMSPMQIENANHITLRNDELGELSALFEPVIIDKSRYKFMESSDVSLFGEETKITYVFFDNKLYKYIIQINLKNKQKVENEILPMLKSHYGDGNPDKPKSKEEVQSYKWKTNYKEISFSLYENQNTKSYEAIIRVTYLPIYKNIENISRKEKNNYF